MGTGRAWRLRPADAADVGFLRVMLYEALYVPTGEEPPPGHIVDEPELSRYVDGFGTAPGDLGSVSVCEGRPAGACWLRLFSADAPGYGWVGDDIPELSIAVAVELRNRGMGRALIDTVCERARTSGVKRISLSVDSRSPALRLYERVGFESFAAQGATLTMILTLTEP